MIPLSELRQLAEMTYPGERVGAPHLLAAWARCDPGNDWGTLLAGFGTSTERVAASMERLARDHTHAEDLELISRCVAGVRTGQVTGFHLLRVICGVPNGRTAAALTAAGVHLPVLAQRVHEVLSRPTEILAQHALALEGPRLELENYGRDLRKLALDGAFDDLADRPEVLDPVIDVLQRFSKCNVALLGDAGTGKTAIAELLARRVVRAEVPAVLMSTEIIDLSVPLLVAGTRYRGDFEQRMEQVLQAALKLPSVILFVDEFHMLCGAGRAEGVITDGANILKPYLARERGLKVIGATTTKEFHRYIAEDPALQRRFQEIQVPEPDDEMVVKMVAAKAAALAGRCRTHLI